MVLEAKIWAVGVLISTRVLSLYITSTDEPSTMRPPGTQPWGYNVPMPGVACALMEVTGNLQG